MIYSTLQCARCKKEYKFEEVRYLSDRSGVACKACLGLLEKEHIAKRKQEGRLFGFQCISCRYKFFRTANNKPEVCPQCSKRDFIKFQKEKLTASNILRLASDPRFDHLESL